MSNVYREHCPAGDVTVYFTTERAQVTQHSDAPSVHVYDIAKRFIQDVNPKRYGGVRIPTGHH